MPTRIPPRTLASPAPIEPGRRLSDTAYARILEHLFDGTLPAGAFVSQSELVELTAIPVAPLRDALRILEAEGILTIQPRSGIQFVKPGLELTKATFQFRQIQECAAVRIYAEAAPGGALDDVAARHLALIGRIEAGGLASPDLDELDALEHCLHHGVIAILRNPLIEASYRRMHNYLCLVRVDRVLTPPFVLRTLREHMDIIKACQARNPDLAESALRTHFAAALQRHMGLF